MHCKAAQTAMLRVFLGTFFVILSADAFTINGAGRAISSLRMSLDKGTTGQVSRDDFQRSIAAGVLTSWIAVTAPSSAVASVAKSKKLSNTGSGSRVNKDPMSLLRQGLPVECEPAFQLQEAVETSRYYIGRKDWGRALSGVSQAGSIASKKKSEIIAAVRPPQKAEGEKVLENVRKLLIPLQTALETKEGTGTLLERAKLDEAYAAQDALSMAVGSLLELMVPADYVTKLEANIPKEFDKLPRLLGRATVEFVLEKPNKGEKFDVEGTLYDQAKLVMVIDGYTAPITAGCFVDLVQKKFYEGLTITRSDGFVVQAGDPEPEGPVDGYKDRIVPLEISVLGDELPMYSATTEDDGRGYASTKLPFQAYGALGMARSEFEADSASSQFFWLLFESDLTPAGKNLLDGRYSEFGYTVKGAELLKDVKEGDKIISTKILQGGENLKGGK